MALRARSSDGSDDRWASGLVVGLAGAFAVWHRRVKARRAHVAPHQQIVILGGGFGGRDVATGLVRTLPAEAEARIILVDEQDYLLFTPMLTEVAGGELAPRHIISSPRHLSDRIQFVQGRVDGIELAERRVHLLAGAANAGVPPEPRVLKADQLVLALGSIPNWHSIPGVAEHALGMKRLADADAIRNRVLAMLEQADAETAPEVRRGLLCFVVAGGGFTGVETMAALNDLVRAAAQDYPRLDAADIRTVLVDPGERLLPELSADLADYARRKLTQRGVEIRLKTEIVKVDADGVDIKDGPRIAAHTLIWAGGVKPNPLVETLPVKRGKHGGIVVDGTCAVPDYPGVWALGDCAEIPQADSDKTYAPTAQNATREGRLVARNIAAALRGESLRPFTYTPIGELALVGKHVGVAKLYGLKFSGPFAWLMWRFVYVAKMPSHRQQARIVLEWLLDAVLGSPLVEVPAATSEPGRHHC